MKILCTGDVHIGRRSSRLPPGSDSRHHSCAAAWLRIVDVAVAEGVDVVAVTGDLVDQSNRFFEAFGPVEAGLRRLADAGIETLMVAGNHDFDVLPRIVEAVSSGSVRLLGKGGEWQRITIERAGLRVHFDGWSFPREHHPSSPLDGYSPAADGAPTVVLLHADLEQPRSSYAPIALAELRRHPDRIFLLGHVHLMRRVQESGAAQAVYPGSPQAMDPAESGDHGACIIEVTGGGFRTDFRPISTVRYEPIQISLDNVDRIEEVDEAVISRMRERLLELAGDPYLRIAHFRVRLTGRTTLHRQLSDRLRDRLVELEVPVGRAVGTVDRPIFDTRPARDLAALAAAGGAPAILAGLIAELETGAGSGEGLVAEARQAVRDIERASSFLPVLEPASLADDEAAIRKELSRAAMLLLDEMLAQKEDQT